MVTGHGRMAGASQMAGLVMSKCFESRIKQLEVKNQVNQKTVPALVYSGRIETLEQAKARYKEEHGFDLPEHAHVIQIVCVDASCNASIKE